MEIILIGVVLIVGFVLRDISRRQSDLAVRVARLEQGVVAATNTVATGVATPPAPRPVAAAPSVVATPPAPSAAMAWLREEWPMKVGALCLIAAVGWGVTYAFVNDIISPAGRVALGLVFGVAMSAWGVLRATRERLQGDILLTIGAASLLFTMFAGVDYGFFAPTVGLLAMLLVVALMGASAATQDDQMFGVVTVVFGCIAPMFFAYDVPQAMMAWYALLLVAIGVGMAWYRTWTRLMLLMVPVTLIVATMGDGFGFATEGRNALQACMLLAILLLGHAGIMARRLTVSFDAVIAAAWGLLAFVWVTTILTDTTAEALLMTTIALVVSGVTYAIWERSGAVLQVLVYAAVAIGLLVGATAVVLDGPALTVAYVAEITGLIVAGLHILRSAPSRRVFWGCAIVTFAVALVAGVGHQAEVIDVYTSSTYATVVTSSTPEQCDLVPMHDAMGGMYYEQHCFGGDLSTTVPVPHPQDAASPLTALVAIAFAALVVVMMTVRWVMGGTIRSAATRVDDLVALRVFAVIGGVFIGLVLWDVLHLLMNATVATSLAMMLYTVIGIGFYVAGNRERYQAYRVVGSAVMAVVALRLFLVDFWDMSMLWRVVTFGTVGMLLVGMALALRSGRNTTQSSDTLS